MHVWHMKKGTEAKLRRGYPWAFSNELAQSPRHIAPGDPVEMRDYTDAVLAQGYGHPHSLISFRALSRQALEGEDFGVPFLLERLQRAAGLRAQLGLDGASHRLCFAEADGLPGLVVDRYRLAGQPPSQVLVARVSSAGMERLLPAVQAALEALVRQQEGQPGASPWEHTGLILDQGASERALEELPVLPRQWLKTLPACADGLASLLVPAEGEPLTLRANLLSGQKTGLFLDQALNMALAAQLVQSKLAQGRPDRKQPAQQNPAPPAPALRVLDLFCYVGQWGARLAQVGARCGSPAHVVAVDASGPALELAAENIAACGAQVRTLRQDLLAGLEGLEPAAFDVVVCDPPALARRRKDLPKAVRAYQKLAREALRRVAPQGLLVMCSCSGLLPEEEFGAVLQRAQAQTQRHVQWVLRGGQGPDHPVLAEFPESRYLKCWMGVVS